MNIDQENLNRILSLSKDYLDASADERAAGERRRAIGQRISERLLASGVRELDLEVEGYGPRRAHIVQRTTEHISRLALIELGVSPHTIDRATSRKVSESVRVDRITDKKEEEGKTNGDSGTNGG